jgi:subtilisin family serine protease
MPVSRRRTRGSDEGGADEPRGDGNGPEPPEGDLANAAAPGTTGRYLVLLRPDAMAAGLRALSSAAGLNVANSSDFSDGAVDAATLEGAEAVVFDKLAVAVVDTPPEQLRVLSALDSDQSGILAIEPERVVYAIAEDTIISGDLVMSPALPQPASPASALPVQYLMGYRDAVNELVERVLAYAGVPDASASAVVGAAPVPETSLTWGLQLTRVAESPYSGKGVRVAVLDTGMDLRHPDFMGRSITSQSFVAGEQVQDGHGHGTHCIGTACGPRQPGQMPRYGVAYDAEIFVGKVLSNRGSGSDSGILAGINWAITNQCRVISMSLGAPTSPGQVFSRIFEAVARRALAAGCLIIAAAGNESQRPEQINPVGHPANCPSILAVGALDSALQVARFSSGGINLQGGQVDIAGPGVAVRSAWPRPLLYRSISGTSMATPHVAGIAALHAEANPDVTGGALGWLLLQSASRLALSTRDIGAGLVQAPLR